MNLFIPKNLYLVRTNEGKHVAVKADIDTLNDMWADDRIEEFTCLKVIKIPKNYRGELNDL